MPTLARSTKTVHASSFAEFPVGFFIIRFHVCLIRYTKNITDLILKAIDDRQEFTRSGLGHGGRFLAPVTRVRRAISGNRLASDCRITDVSTL